jgi:hypothetical protein
MGFLSFQEWLVREGLMVADDKADASKFPAGQRPSDSATYHSKSSCAGGPGPCPGTMQTGGAAPVGGAPGGAKPPMPAAPGPKKQKKK